jgi:hypothetical protein
MYNKKAIYKFKESHPDEYREMTQNATLKYRWKNIELIREKDRLRKTPFMTEWKTLRNIDIF